MEPKNSLGREEAEREMLTKAEITAENKSKQQSNARRKAGKRSTRKKRNLTRQLIAL